MSHLTSRSVTKAGALAALLLAIPATADAATETTRLANGKNACVEAPTTKAFAGVDGDRSDYSQAPGGDFEVGSAPWTLTGGAKLVGGNENIGVTSGKRALSLPLGGVATSPKFCVDETKPHFRFAFKADSLAAGFIAKISYQSTSGVKTTQLVSSKQLKFVPSRWIASPLSPLSTLLPLAGGTASVQIQLFGANVTGTTSVIGTLSRGAITLPTATIDSVMVDPYRRS